MEEVFSWAQRKETMINQPMKMKNPSADTGTDPEFIRQAVEETKE